MHNRFPLDHLVQNIKVPLLIDYLITGCGGFVASHYLGFLRGKNFQGQVIGIGLSAPRNVPEGLNFTFQRLDMLDSHALAKLIKETRPRYCVHLASMSSVAASWKTPKTSFVNNTNIFLNLVESVRETSPDTRVLSVGSSEQYARKSQRYGPLVEEDSTGPSSPYAVARCAQEELGQTYITGYGLDIVMTRSFNHIGPGQNSRFVLSGFAKCFAEASVRGESDAHIRTGDLNITRDFLDVRDVVVAYDKILKTAPTGSLFNVCSGSGVKLKTVLDLMSELSDCHYSTTPDPSLLRPVENRIIVGSNETITAALKWAPLIPLEKSLKDVLDYWANAVSL